MNATKIPGWGYPLGEVRQPLSASFLWELERAFYDREGPDAWAERALPSYVTSNTWMGDLYARLVHGCLWDSSTSGALPPGATLHVVELASGSGELGFRLLRRLSHLLRTVPPPNDVKVRLVMTDFAASNLDSWLAHPGFEPFLDEGMLDVATFDAERDTELRLRRSGDVLKAGELPGPLVVIANYLFDSLPQDAYLVRDGELFERRVTVTSSMRESDPFAVEVTKRLQLHYEEVPVRADRYEDPDLNALLERYPPALPSGSFLLPVAAVGCVRRLRELAGDRLLLMVADKGYTCVEELAIDKEPHVSMHNGCFSFMVNLHALAMHCELQGGETWLRGQNDDAIVAGAFGFGESHGPWTRRVLEELTARVGPEDYHLMVQLIQERETVDAHSFVALLGMAHYDPQIVDRMGHKVDLSEAGYGTHARLRLALARVRQEVFWRDGPYSPLPEINALEDVLDQYE